FLVYELNGLGHWTSAARRVNGGPTSGGRLGNSGEGGLQVEEISPRWVRQGENLVEFLPVSASTVPKYRVSRVRLIGVSHAAASEALPLQGSDTEANHWG